MGGIETIINFIKDENTHPALFISLMTFLPLFGFPISLFLITAGVKFGIIWGLLVSALTMLFHVIASFAIARYLFKQHIEALVAKTKYTIPQVPEEKILPFALIFTAVPGLPYTLKNYVLAVAGVPFRYFLPIAWGVQWIMGVVFLGIGSGAAEMDWKLLSIFGGILVAGYFFIRRLNRRYGHIVQG